MLFAPPLSTSVINDTQVHVDNRPDGYHPTGLTDDECTDGDNIAFDAADKTTADPVKSTSDYNATATANASSNVENGPTTDTSSDGSNS